MDETNYELFGDVTLSEAVLLATLQAVTSNAASQYRYCNVASNTASDRVDIL